MIIRVADYDSDAEILKKIRFDVFVNKQNVPENIEMDERDPFCIHLIAYETEKAVGTCRIDVDQQGKVGRLAVLASHRSQGIGKLLMTSIHEIAKQKQHNKVWCHAQVAVVPFYETFSYQKIGKHFYEANVEHVKMEYSLLY